MTLTRDLTANVPDRARKVVGINLAAFGSVILLLNLVGAYMTPADADVLAVAPIAAILVVVGLRLAGPKDARSFRLFRR